jgi:hypothetical protein
LFHETNLKTNFGNAGLISDQRYQTDPDASMAMPMPDEYRKKLMLKLD